MLASGSEASPFAYAVLAAMVVFGVVIGAAAALAFYRARGSTGRRTGGGDVQLDRGPLCDIERRLNDVQRIARIGLWELDLRTESLRWSSEIFRIFELDETTFRPSYDAFLNLVHPDDRDLVSESYAKSLLDRAQYSIDHRLRMPDGRVKWVREQCETEFDVAGNPLISRGTVQDITEQRDKDDKIDESRAIISDLLEISEEAIILAGDDGFIILFSRGAEAVFGYAASEALGMPFERLVPERLRGRHSEHVQRFRAGDVSSIRMETRVEVLGLRKDGSEFPAAISISKTPRGGGLIYSIIVRDIGPEKARLQAMTEAKQAAEAANMAKSSFLANMGHELRTPLNAILGFSEMIAASGADASQTERNAEYARDIYRSGKRLLRVVNDMLEMSSIEAGGVEPRYGMVDVAALARSAVAEAAELASDGQSTVEIDIQTDIPKLNADGGRLRQALANLLSNAVRFSPPGARVVVSAAFDERDGWVIRVVDEGVGMRAEDIPEAFRPFVQLDGGLSRHFEGSGLGLPIAKGFVEIQGGCLELESAVGVGTTAAIRFGPDSVSARNSDATSRPVERRPLKV